MIIIQEAAIYHIPQDTPTLTHVVPSGISHIILYASVFC